MLKKTALGLLLLPLLLLLLGSILKRDEVAEKARVFTAARLSEMIGQPVEINKARLTLLPPSVRLIGITSRGKFALHTEEARATLSLLSFFTSSWVIQKLVIRNPSLAWSEIELKLDSKDRSVIIRKIQIEEGTLTYRSDQKTFFLPHLNAMVFPDAEMNRFDVTFSGRGGHVISERKRPLTSWQGTLIVDAKSIEIQEAEVTSNQARAKATGVITLSSATRIGLDLQVNASVPLGDLHDQSPARIQWETVMDRLKTLSGTLQLEGHIQGEWPNPTIIGTMAIPRLFQNIPRAEPALDAPPVDPIRSVRSDFSYKDKTLSFKNIAAEIFSGQLKGAAEMDFPTLSERRKYHLQLHYDRLALDKASSFFISEVSPSLLHGKVLTGQFLLSGEGAEWTTSGEMRLTQEDKMESPPPSAWSWLAPIEKGRLQWTGSREKIHFDQADISFSEGTAFFPGTWDPQTGLALHLQVNGQDIKPIAEAVNIPMTGQLHLTGALTGEMSQPSFSGHVQLKNWTMKRRAFGPLESDLSYRDKTILFEKGSVKSKEGVRKGIVRGNGMIRFGEKLIYEIQSEARDVNPQEILSLFIQGVRLETTVSGKLHIRGEEKRVSVTGPIQVGDGVLYGESFEKGNFHITITEKKVRINDARIEKEGIVAKGSGEISYTGEYMLDVVASARKLQTSDIIHRFRPDLSGDMRLTVRGKGSLKNPHLQFTADVAKLQYQDSPLGAGEMNVLWKGNKITARSHFPAKRFAFSGKLATQAPHPFSFQTEFDYFPMHVLFAHVKPAPLGGFSLYASGNVSGQGYANRLDQMDLASHLTLLSAHKGDYRLANTGPIELSAKKGAFSIKNSSFKGPNTNLLLSGGFTPLKAWGLLVKGEADINILRFFTRIQSARGVAHLDLRITDSWKTPNIHGILSLPAGTVYLSSIAQPVVISSLALMFNQRRLTLESVEGKIGSGRFSGVGQAIFSGFSLSQFGFNMDVVEMPIAWGLKQTAVVEGGILFRGSGKEQTLEGTVHIRQAVYEKRVDLKQMLLDWQTREERLPIEIPLIGSTRLNIHLYGKENIGVDNNLAHVALDVDLHMKGSLEKPLLFGQVTIPKGTFRFRTNDFKIRSGMVQFVHPMKIDPVFDIQGESRIRNYDLGLSLQGTLDQFTLDISSSPSLPRADILSLLVIGKTTQEVSVTGDEAKTFLVADLVSGFLAEPIKQLTTLDRIHVGAATSAKGGKSSENTLISMEKRLLDDQLLVVYSKSLDPSREDSTILFYELGKNLAVAGGRDEDGQMGGDLRFRFEFR